MKKLSFLFAILMMIHCGFAQHAIDKDQGATSILNTAVAKYSSYSSITIKFTVKTYKDKKVLSSFRGDFIIKHNKYKAILEDQTIYCDGNTLWNYQKESNEVSIFAYEAGDEPMFHPTKILNNWQKNFNARFVREFIENNKTLQIIDLIPIKSQAYYKIRLFLDKNKKQIVRSEIYEKDNTMLTYYVDSFNPNLDIPDATFIFNTAKYPNVLINDMR